MLEDNKLIIHETVPCYATDSHQRLRPSAFMDYAQELANQSATELGFGYDVVIKDKRAWILSRFHIIFKEAIHWRDNIKIATWHKGLNGLFFVRDFVVSNERGEECIAATSSWLVLDLENRSLVRTDRIEQLIPENTECHDDAIAEVAPKIIMPRGIQPEQLGSHVVNYSDIDCNGHTNNVRYVVWSMDAAGPEITFKRPVRELFINFNKETHLGETVDLYRHIDEREDGTTHVTVEGRVEGTQSFCCKLVF